MIRAYKVGANVTLTILRNGKDLSVPVPLARSPKVEPGVKEVPGGEFRVHGEKSEFPGQGAGALDGEQRGVVVRGGTRRLGGARETGAGGRDRGRGRRGDPTERCSRDEDDLRKRSRGGLYSKWSGHLLRCNLEVETKMGERQMTMTRRYGAAVGESRDRWAAAGTSGHFQRRQPGESARGHGARRVEPLQRRWF